MDGFRRGRAAPKIFFHLETQVSVVLHGNDFTFAGTDSELEKIKSKMYEWYDVKVRAILGSGRRDIQEIGVACRTFSWTEQGLEYEAGDTHRQALLRALLRGQKVSDDSKTVNSAALKN